VVRAFFDEVSHLSCGDNQVAVFQGVDDVFLVFICRVFREFMEVVVVEKVIYFAGVVFVVLQLLINILPSCITLVLYI
jgi:hypothetical protein